MSDLSNDADHGGVTDEQLEQFFANNPNLRPLEPLSSEPEPEPEPQPAPTEGEPEAAPDTAAPESPPESLDDDFLDLGGTRYARSQIEAAAQFQQHLVNDPSLQRLINDYLTGQQYAQQQPQPEPPPPPEPPDIDLDDPSLRALYNLVQQQSQQIGQLQQGLRTTYDQATNSQRQQVDAQYRVAADAFAKDHSLEEQDVEQLSQVAARLGVIPQLMHGVDPITGTPSSPDPVRAFQRALEIALFMVPEYREREFKRSVSTMQQEAQKRKLLGAVGGSSGSVARTQTPPTPGSPEARRAMLAEVGAMLTGNWQDPNSN